MERLEREADEQHAANLRDRFITLSSEAYGHAAAYDNAVIVAGYAAFFALWASVSEDITSAARLATVSLMGVSLMLYFSWHMIQMLTRQSLDRARAATFRLQADPAAFDKAWKEAEQRRGIALQRTLRFWPYIFVPSLAFGLAGAIVLAYNAVAALFGWPQLTS